MKKIKNVIRITYLKLIVTAIHKLKKAMKKQQKYGDERILELAALIVKEVKANGYETESCGIPITFDIIKHCTSELAVQSVNNHWKIGGKHIGRR
jgi:hypothetical protein